LEAALAKLTLQVSHRNGSHEAAITNKVATNLTTAYTTVATLAAPVINLVSEN
jgi:hypothetical protein